MNHPPRISLVVAMAKNRVIGTQNKLPWHIPEDLKRFREITTGHPIIMGRKTYESIGKPLPNRTNIVVTREAAAKGARFEGCLMASSLDEAIRVASGVDVPGREELMVIGGGEIYRQALARADRIYLTRLDHDVEGETYFPEIPAGEFKETSHERRSEPFGYSFIVLDRK